MADKYFDNEYNGALDKVFRTSPLTYKSINEVGKELDEYNNKAFSLFKEKKFLEAGSLYKSLLQKTIEHFIHISDTEGILGKHVFQFFSYLSQCVKSSDLDKKLFFNETLDFYLKEDLGFTTEIINLILSNCEGNDCVLLEKLCIDLLENQKLTKYAKEKIIFLLIDFYKKNDNNDNFFEMCRLLSPDRAEKYILMSDKYESMGRLDDAVDIYKKGIQLCSTHKEMLETKYKALEKRILGF